MKYINRPISWWLLTGMIIMLSAHFMELNCTIDENTKQSEQKPTSIRPRVKQRNNADLPPEYEVVYPRVSDKYGRSPGTSNNLRARKHKLRKTRENLRRTERLFIVIKTKKESLLLSLKRNKKIAFIHPPVDFSNGKDDVIAYEPCHYTGRVKSQKNSLVALSNCNGLSGLIRTSNVDYFIEPKYTKRRNITMDSPHILYRVQTALSWKNVSIAGDFLMKTHRHKRYIRDIDLAIKMDEDLIPINKSTKLYLEILVAADETLETTHASIGKKNAVAQYIMTLMNIVSTIYADPALNANIEIVVVQIVFVNKEKDNVHLKTDDKQASIDNICNWANNLYKKNKSTAPSQDLTIFLTRDSIGGPAGFAPLSSICEEKSCAVANDGGLTSAFVLSHEIAHVLGLSHDGYEFGGNKCNITAGSIMAPIVNSTYDHYHWSKCSIGEFHKKRE